MALELTDISNVVTVDGHSSGLWYAEIVLDAATLASGGGVYPADLGCGTQHPPSSGAACSQPGFGYRKDGKIIKNGDQIGSTETALSNGDRVNIAINLTSGKAWLGRNGTWILSGDPAAGTNETTTIGAGTWYLGASIYANGTTENFKASVRTQNSQFTDTVPTGFTSWSGV